MINIYQQTIEKLDQGKKFAMATLIETKGSSPQVPGSVAIIDGNMVLAGTLGGGLIEIKSTRNAASAIANQQSCLCDYDLNADINSSEGAICGGSVRVLIDVTPQNHTVCFKTMLSSLDNGEPGLLLTKIKIVGNTKIDCQWLSLNEIIEQGLPEILRDHEGKCLSCLKKNTNSLIEPDAEEIIFLQAMHPLPKLIIAGAGHIGKAMVHLAKLLDFEITVIDDRPEYANPGNLPEADHIIIDPVGQALASIPFSLDSYILIVTRGHHDDAEALKACINSNVRYIGMIGSKRKVKLMREDFVNKKWASPEQFDRVHAPVGIDINSVSVQEIAVSISAELIRVRNENKRNKTRFASIILAAGTSSRMGKAKMLLPYGRKSIVETVCMQSNLSEVNYTHLILGSDADKIEGLINKYEINTVINDKYLDGMLSSVQCGMQSLPDEVDAVVILLGDQPMIDFTIINRVIHAYKNSEKELIVATHEGNRGHPLVIGKKYFNEIMQYTLDNSLKKVLQDHPEDIHEVDIENSSILRDIDTEKDYNKERSLLMNK